MNTCINPSHWHRHIQSKTIEQKSNKQKDLQFIYFRKF